MHEGAQPDTADDVTNCMPSAVQDGPAVVLCIAAVAACAMHIQSRQHSDKVVKICRWC